MTYKMKARKAVLFLKMTSLFSIELHIKNKAATLRDSYIYVTNKQFTVRK